MLMFAALRLHPHDSLYTEDHSYYSPKHTTAACGRIQSLSGLPCLVKVAKVDWTVTVQG